MADKGITVHRPYRSNMAVMPFKPVKKVKERLTNIKGICEAEILNFLGKIRKGGTDEQVSLINPNQRLGGHHYRAWCLRHTSTAIADLLYSVH
jgi:uncharacterized protein with von Willebrand factor type A (vWA) domain